MNWKDNKTTLDSFLIENRKNELRGALMMLNAVDIAEYLASLENDKMLKAFRILPKAISSDVFSYMDDEQRQKLLASISDVEMGALIDNMFVDDAVDFLEELPADLVHRLLANVSEEQRKVINRFLSYPENSVGSIMTIEYCEFSAKITVGEAMRELKRTGVDKETINTLYVVDPNGTLAGTIPLRKLLMSEDNVYVEQVMSTDLISVRTLDNKELAADLVRKYDLLALPVTDQSGRLVGIVTADDIMDVIQQRDTEDIEKMSALKPSNNTYLRTKVWTLAANRLPWLAVMMFASMLAGFIVTHYEEILVSSPSLGVALTACIPLLMDTGGNCGQQSSTLVIRSLALGNMQLKDGRRVLFKEFRVALLVGVVLSFVNFFIQCFFFSRGWQVSLTVSIAMLATILMAKMIGVLLPLGAKALKLDPALTATPLITTVVDTTSLILLFEAVKLFLPA